jgi:hypothetical protein
MVTETVRISLTLYPELGRLIELREGHRWVFGFERDEDGEILLVHGGRLWPNGWSEAVAIRNRDDARACRLDPAHDLVWECEGGVVDVLDGLADLPGADEGRPYLVRGTGTAPKLWLPRSARGLR